MKKPAQPPTQPTVETPTAPVKASFEIRQYFPTPVGVLAVPGAEDINRALKPLLLARAKTHPSTRHSNLGGWQSDWNLMEWGGPAGRRLLDAAKAFATRLTADRHGRPVRIDWRLNAWGNINRRDHGNEFHTHPGSYWSGAYYVDDGGVGDDPALGGEFEIQDPRGVAPAMYAPNLAFAVPGCQSVGASELIRPRTGTLLLFPAWLSHAVRPYTGEGTRISVAFNLSL